MKTIKLTTGRLNGHTLPVIEEDDKSVKCEIPKELGGGTILIPRTREDGLKYFEEVA